MYSSIMVVVNMWVHGCNEYGPWVVLLLLAVSDPGYIQYIIVEAGIFTTQCTIYTVGDLCSGQYEMPGMR